MNPIQSFHCKLRGLATKLDGETARLLRALDGEDSEDFEVSPVRILYDLHSEVQTLKDNVNALLDKARLGSQESTSFIKATKILMKKNSADIINIRDFFQKYGYQARDKEDSAHELGVSTSNPELAVCKDIHEPGGKEEQSDPCVPSGSVSEELLRSPQLSDFGLQRYMVSQVPANPPQTNVSLQEEGVSESPAKESSVQMPKTPRCALKMDDFECVTPKLEHFGISEYTMCLNEDYTMGLKNMKNIKSSPLSGASGEAIGTEPVTSANSLAIPGPIIQQLEKNDVEYINSPLPPKFCTPGLKIPSTMDSTDLVSLDYPLSKPNSSSTDLEVKDCTPLILNSDECYQSIADSPTPTVTSCENFTTPSPPKVTAIPEDILQMLKHNSNLAYSTDVKALPLKGFLTYKGQSSRGAANKENW